MHGSWCPSSLPIGRTGSGWQLRNGSPVCPTLQLQIGLWLNTSQRALMPQAPRHGSTHFWLTQACVDAHSELTTHSGRHCGGEPIYPWMHEHTAWSFTSRHWLLGPHGDGVHTSRLRSGTISAMRQFTNGSPVYPVGHEQIGMWFTTSHCALWPHVPGHGSTHLLRKQALSRLHSAFVVHSGRQPSYGLPWYSATQRHSPPKQSAFGPQGDGLHKSFGTGLSVMAGFGVHWTNGSPIKSSLHVQIGTWFKTWQPISYAR